MSDSREGDTLVTVCITRPGTWEKQRLTLGAWYEVWREPVSIGRNPDCKIAIDAPELAPVQAIVTRRGHHHYLEVVEGSTRCVGRTESTKGTTWRISGIGDPEPIEIGPFRVVIRSGERKRWWQFWR